MDNANMENDSTTIVRLCFAILFILFALYIGAMNCGGVLIALWNQRKGIHKSYSAGPILSIISAGIGYFLYPYSSRMWIWFIPVLDIGNWILLYSLVIIGKEFLKKNNP